MNFATDVAKELERARWKHPHKFHSLHEAYAILLEEVDEFKAEVWKGAPDSFEVYAELVQIAAMAQRSAEDVLRDKKGYYAE